MFNLYVPYPCIKQHLHLSSKSTNVHNILFFTLYYNSPSCLGRFCVQHQGVAQEY